MKKLKLLFLLSLITLNSYSFESGHCPVGPFGTDGDTGPYEGRCHELEASEICEAYLNGVLDGDILDVDPAKVQFCLNML